MALDLGLGWHDWSLRVWTSGERPAKAGAVRTESGKGIPAEAAA